jgi:hypothetical protein
MPAGLNEQKELAMPESRGQSIRIDGWQARSKAQVHPVKLNSSHFKFKETGYVNAHMHHCRHYSI